MKTKATDKLVNKRHILIEQFLCGEAPDFLEKHAALVDEYLFAIFEQSLSAQKMTVSGYPFAMVALGGYGRKEHCIHSDIDLLILFENEIPPEVEAFIQELLYPLWDAGFEVGYAVRTILDSLTMAFERFDILTTVLDARFICGASLIYSRFMEQFREQLAENHLGSTLKYLYENGEKRHFDHGDSTYRIAPDLKSGFGGLRDYHTLLWYAKIKSNIKTRKELIYDSFLSHMEYETLEESLGAIWKTRNFLHHTIGRKCDTLHFEYQDQLAALLGYSSGNGQPAVEFFLGDLHAKMDFLKQINQFTFENIRHSLQSRRKGSKTVPTGIDGLVINKNRLYFSNTVIVMQTPALLLKIFLESGQRKIPLSVTSRRIISEFAHLMDDTVVSDPENIAVFKKILALSFWEFNVLNVMLTTGLLEKFIPEFSAIVHKIQFNHYHLFPVDKHSIRCVQLVNGFRKPGNDQAAPRLYHAIFREIRDKTTLLFAALLHDIGKSEPDKEHSKTGAAMAEKILSRFDLTKQQIQDCTFLIENHLFLIKTATRRDISDEETVIFVANKIQKVTRLRMLYLLTVADSKATGPKAWNQWTENLLMDLFLKTMSMLKKGDLVSRKTQKMIEKKKESVLQMTRDKWEKQEIISVLNNMSQRYLLYVSDQDIVRHIQLFFDLKDRDFTWHISKEDNSDIRSVCICGREKPGVYSKIAGVFFVNDLDIVASQAYAFGNGFILDIFKVLPPKDTYFEKEKWGRVKKDLSCALEDERFLDHAFSRIPEKIHVSYGKTPQPNAIKIDNDASSFFTIIEIFTYDFPGLLFVLTNALYQNRANVDAAMISTKVDQVVDVFYIRDIENDRKIESEQRLEQIQKTILETLPKIERKETVHEKN